MQLINSDGSSNGRMIVSCQGGTEDIAGQESGLWLSQLEGLTSASRGITRVDSWNVKFRTTSTMPKLGEQEPMPNAKGVDGQC
jgi:hypothetical protein